jgi:hypothetical protein
MRYFCTYFDQNFIYQGLALYESLRQHAGDFTLWILCFDETTYVLLNRLNLPGLRTIHLEDFEEAYPDLVATKADRSFLEYYWTATPMLPLYVLNSQPHVDAIAYLDADLFFYNDLQPIYDEWGDGSIYLIPHRFAPEHRKSGELHSGLYNVGFVGFRRDESGLAALKRWERQNLEWCYNHSESGRLGDQKYLHDWAERFSGVVVSQNHGIGAGGWNLLRYRISQRNGLIYLDECQLVMLHLNFVSLLSPKCFCGMARWRVRPVYRPYARALHVSIERLRQMAPEFRPNYSRIPYWLFIKRLVRGGIVFI